MCPCKYFLPVCGFFSRSLVIAFHGAEVFNFNEVQLISYFSHGLCLRVVSKKSSLGLPGGAVVENLPANARGTGSSPGLGRSHMPRGNWAREPQLLSMRVWSLCSATREAAILKGPRTAMKSGPRSPQLEKATTESPRTETKTQHSQK